jgi:predicted RNA binding protein YcfA (HicA-like mRNA interferase family)
VSSFDKLIAQVLSGKNLSYKDAERILFKLHFELSVSGSHHIFRKDGYARAVSIKKRPELLGYQVKLLQEVLKDHGYVK